jgi:FMN phosphatase YigB (HAD superfamily)
MGIKAKWVGFDFGQTLMDTRRMRNYLVIGDTCKELGEPELIGERVHKFHAVKEKYGSYTAVGEAHSDEVMAYVFDNKHEAQEILPVAKQRHLFMAKGLKETLCYLVDEGISLSVVAELKKTLGPMGTDVVSRFLDKHNLRGYFENIVCPQGKFDLNSGFVDLRYKGKTKEEGTIYDVLALDLKQQGIDVSEAAIIGDKLSTDILPAKQRGFVTIQYTGYIDMGMSRDADFRIFDFCELKTIITGKSQGKGRRWQYPSV